MVEGETGLVLWLRNSNKAGAFPSVIKLAHGNSFRSLGVLRKLN